MNFAWNAVLRDGNPKESGITEETTTTARGMPDVIRCGPYAERSDGRGWNKQMARVVSGWWTQERDRKSSAAACGCLLNGVRAECGLYGVCVSMFRRPERTKWWRNSGNQVVLFPWGAGGA